MADVSMKQIGRRLATRLTASAPARRLLRDAAERSWLPQSIYQRLPPGVASFEVGFGDGTSFRYAVDREDPFVRQLYWRGMESPEAASLRPFHDLARSATVVADVGAHTGLYSLAALSANPEVRVVSFEPVPGNVARLRDNLTSNGWLHRTDIVPMAVSDFTGTTPLHIPFGDHPMSGSLDPSGFRGQAGAVTDVACISLDDHFSSTTPDLVKIDVEGFEDVVLAGMERILERARPVIIVECNPDGPTEQVQAILSRHNYLFQTLRGRRTTPPTPVIEPDQTEVFRNVLCQPQ